METQIEVADTLQKNIPLERKMIGRDKHGAILELAKQGTPKKAMPGCWVRTSRPSGVCAPRRSGVRTSARGQARGSFPGSRSSSPGVPGKS